MQRLRVGTWNIGGGLVAAHRPLQFDTEDLLYFAATLRPLCCDVLCLQEVHTPITGNQPSQAGLLADKLHMPYRISLPCDTVRVSHLKADQFISLAILSQWNLQNACYTMLPNPQLQTQVATGAPWVSHDKGFLRASLTFVGREIVVLTGHTVPFSIFDRDVMEDAFMPIRTKIEKIILATSDQPTIVAGDLNCEAVERLLPHVFEVGYARALFGVSTEPNRGRQLDHILVSPHWHVMYSTAIVGRADHYFCYADIALNPQSNQGHKSKIANPKSQIENRKMEA